MSFKHPHLLVNSYTILPCWYRAGEIFFNLWARPHWIPMLPHHFVVLKIQMLACMQISCRFLTPQLHASPLGQLAAGINYNHDVWHKLWHLASVNKCRCIKHLSSQVVADDINAHCTDYIHMTTPTYIQSDSIGTQCWVPNSRHVITVTHSATSTTNAHKNRINVFNFPTSQKHVLKSPNKNWGCHVTPWRCAASKDDMVIATYKLHWNEDCDSDDESPCHFVATRKRCHCSCKHFAIITELVLEQYSKTWTACKHLDANTPKKRVL